MTPTLQDFYRALMTPDLSFRTLKSCQPEPDANGIPSLCRTTRFAECQIQWHGQMWLLSMPLTSSAIPYVMRTATVIKRLHSDFIASYTILPDELTWCEEDGEEHHSDLILQRLPGICTFDEALLTEDHTRLRHALDTLEEEMNRMGFVHNNLKGTNLRWCDGRLIPIRYHDARLYLSHKECPTPNPDTEAFTRLRMKLRTSPEEFLTVRDTESYYNPMGELGGHLWVSTTFEGLVCVEDESGYGYVDTLNREVIPSRFVWANDFHEGRAEVETPQGMGLIDKEGHYVLPPVFEVVRYDPTDNVAHVRKEGLWALYDHNGSLLRDFAPEEEELLSPTTDKNKTTK